MIGPGHHGSGFAADLEKLRAVGGQNLPAAAALFAKANNYVADTGSMQEAFQGSDPFGGKATLDAWVGLRDDVQFILATMATTLDRTGIALCQCADDYANVDTEAARELDRLQSMELKSAHPPMSSPKVPSVHYPVSHSVHPVADPKGAK